MTSTENAKSLSERAFMAVDQASGRTLRGSVRVGTAFAVVNEVYFGDFFGVPIPRDVYQKALHIYQTGLHPMGENMPYLYKEGTNGEGCQAPPLG